jgi:hypothetical protein
MRNGSAAWIAMAAVLLAGAPGEAVEKCSAKVNAKTGAIEVSGRSVVGNPLWRRYAGATPLPFADADTCVGAGKFRKCHLGAPGTLEERAAPAACEIEVSDEGPDACVARIPGCTPGLRDGEPADLSSNSSFVTLYVGNTGEGGAIRADTGEDGKGSAVTGYNYGTDRYAGEFEILRTDNPRAAIYARTAGTGQAIDAEVNSNTTADALFARTTSATAGSYAGVFSGPVQISCSAATCNTTNALQVVGNFAATAKAFQIDHPLDPANRYLRHASIESPDMKNLYDGIVTTDSNGLATVALPDWFEALNRDFRYQLTTIGTFAQAIVKDEIAENRFTIQTDRPGVKVSWQVTGIRHDLAAERHRVKVEEDKPADERGTYLEPPAAEER